MSRDYFRVMGLRLAAGRGFTEEDERRQRASFIINRTLARAYFGTKDPIGQALYLWGTVVGDVVGIVEDLHLSTIDAAPSPQLFMTMFQTTTYLPVAPSGLYFAVRTGLAPGEVVARIRDVVRRVDPVAAVDNVATMNQIVANSIRTPRSYAWSLGCRPPSRFCWRASACTAS